VREGNAPALLIRILDKRDIEHDAHEREHGVARHDEHCPMKQIIK
jgi:hypothetical protein